MEVDNIHMVDLQPTPEYSYSCMGQKDPCLYIKTFQAFKRLQYEKL